MGNNTLPAPQFELPQPQVKRGSEALAPQESDQDVVQVTERRNTELPAAPAPAAPVSSAQAAQAAQSIAAAEPAGGVAGLIPGLAPAQAPPADDPLVAEEGDLIEKAWVQKAKAIVEHTRSDPHRQTTEINKVKKEYIQKRYHKDVKLNDE